MRKFVLRLTEFDCDEDFNPKRYRGLKHYLVFDEKELEMFGKQAVYSNLFKQMEATLNDMKTMYLEDKINTDENSLIEWQKYKKENEDV